MEFPSAGVQCSQKDCKQLDFLPFPCTYCMNTFCKEHFQASSHACSKVKNNIATGTEKTKTFECSLCPEKSPVQMPCVKCQKHFCLTHRYHDCFELDPQEKLNQLKEWEKPKQEFSKAKSNLDKEIANKLKNSKNTKMANKVQLMRLKGKSVGSTSIPSTQRCYFLVHLPLEVNAKNSQGVFVSTDWSIGKAIDSMADYIKIPNHNNVSNAKKLRMFDFSTGNIVTREMGKLLHEFFQENHLTDGQDVILEYSNENQVDCSLYQ